MGKLADEKMEIPLRRRWAEIGAVAATVLLKFVLVDGLDPWLQIF